MGTPLEADTWSQYPKIISEMADTLSWKDKSLENIENNDN
jgi:hypothetical protein